MKQLMLNAMQDEYSEGLSPLGVFAELRNLLKLKSVYEWLQIEPRGGYHDVDAFVDQVRDRWLSRVDDEVRSAMGLVNEAQYVELFTRYILHVSYSVKGQLYNESTGRAEEPDRNLMEELERIWKVEAPQEHRTELISAWGPGVSSTLARTSTTACSLTSSSEWRRTTTKQRHTLAAKTRDVLKLLDELDELEALDTADDAPAASKLSAQDRRRAQRQWHPRVGVRIPALGHPRVPWISAWRTVRILDVVPPSNPATRVCAGVPLSLAGR